MANLSEIKTEIRIENLDEFKAKLKRVDNLNKELQSAVNELERYEFKIKAS